jgi:hypothetical protein
MSDNITIVTGLWDIKRDELSEGWSRTYEHYIENFTKLLDIPNNMIIFGDESLREIVFKKRNNNNTQFIARGQEWFKSQFYNEIQSIRTNPEWYNQAGWLSNSTQAKLEMYNPLVMSKPFLLNDAKILDKFDSTHLFWLDAGITNTVHPGYFTHDKVLDKLYNIDTFSFLSFPYETKTEIHGFKYDRIEEICGQKVDRVCRGGFFGGPKSTITNFMNHYYDVMKNTLSEGLMGTEESLFTILTYLDNINYQYFEINGNGLINKFFEDLKNDRCKPKNQNLNIKSKGKENNDLDTSNTALYVITFNSPKQLQTLIDSFYTYDNDFISRPKKYILNNSTDESTDEEYKIICQEYDFTELRFRENLGICGGRQFIAEHAEKNNYDFYFFFEDDMFLYPKKGETCKNGFNRYVPNLYQKIMKISKSNNFDFLKLSFTEFYGDNGTQWAWYNVPQNFRESHWTEYNKLPKHGLDKNSPKTKFENINSFGGIPYVNGEIYYCNWPQIVSKTGNKKMFLTEKWARPYEQTWMSYIFQETIKGNIKPGMLLVSPIEHDRFDHYDKKDRKES